MERVTETLGDLYGMHWPYKQHNTSRNQRLLPYHEELKKKGNPLVFVGDVVGTGSSRKSATNSVLWHMGDDIPSIPNKKKVDFVLVAK